MLMLRLLPFSLGSLHKIIVLPTFSHSSESESGYTKPMILGPGPGLPLSCKLKFLVYCPTSSSIKEELANMFRAVCQGKGKSGI